MEEKKKFAKTFSMNKKKKKETFNDEENKYIFCVIIYIRLEYIIPRDNLLSSREPINKSVTEAKK